MSEEKVVRVACKGAGLIDIGELREFQGNLKSLSEVDYQKLRGEIVELGFSFPFNIWKDKKQNFLLDGHQRCRTLMKMREEGWKVPPLPYSLTEASSFKEAKQKLLGAASQYGRVESQGLYEFMTEAELDIDELHNRVRFPELDMDIFRAEYFETPPPPDDEQKDGSKELGSEDFDGLAHTCPRCGFTFDSKTKKQEGAGEG